MNYEYEVATRLEFLGSNAGAISYFGGVILFGWICLRAFIRVKWDWALLSWSSDKLAWTLATALRLGIIALSVILACSIVNVCDRELRDRVEADARATAADIRELTAKRLHNRTRELVYRIDHYNNRQKNGAPLSESWTNPGEKFGGNSELVRRMKEWEELEFRDQRINLSSTEVMRLSLALVDSPYSLSWITTANIAGSAERWNEFVVDSQKKRRIAWEALRCLFGTENGKKLPRADIVNKLQEHRKVQAPDKKEAVPEKEKAKDTEKTPEIKKDDPKKSGVESPKDKEPSKTEEEKKKDADRKEWEDIFGKNMAAACVDSLCALFLDGERKVDGVIKKLDTQDIYDLQVLFDWKADGVAVHKRVLDFIGDPWREDEFRKEADRNGNTIPAKGKEASITDAYAETIPEISGRISDSHKGIEKAAKFVGNPAISGGQTTDPNAPKNEFDHRKFWLRLGTTYQEPTPREVAKKLAVAIEETYPPKDDPAHARFVRMLVSFALAEPKEAREIESDGSRKKLPVDTALYDQDSPSPPMEEYLLKKHFSGVQEQIAKKIENRSSGKFAFDLKVTHLQFRAIIRGPVQLATLSFFIWGLLTLLIRGVLMHLLPQLSYIIYARRPDSAYDPYSVRWSEIWIGCRAPAGDPVFRQILASERRAKDLFPHLLRRMFLAVESGKTFEETEASVSAATDEWVKEQESNERFLDFILWLMPSIGFFGTALGIGRAMAMANGIMTPDPDAQARNISEITEALGTKFYTTLVALACTIAFGFATLGYRALFAFMVRRTKRQAHYYLRTRVRFREAAVPPTAKPPLPPPPAPIDHLPLFLEVMGGLIMMNDDVDPFENHPSGRRLSTSRGTYLGTLLVGAGVVTAAEWREEERNPWAFERLPRLIDGLPPWLTPLAEMVYLREVRPIGRACRSAGLNAGKNNHKFWSRVQALSEEYLTAVERCLRGYRILKFRRFGLLQRWEKLYKNLGLNYQRLERSNVYELKDAKRWFYESADRSECRPLRLLADIAIVRQPRR